MDGDTPNLEGLFSGLTARSLASTLFNTAHAYARASDTSWSAIAATSDADFAAPSIMCQCFAIELLLKFFVVADNPTCQSFAELADAGVSIKGHKFSGLFERISAAGQSRIAASFSRIEGKVATPADVGRAFLELGDDPFVHWRYVYEKPGYSSLDKHLLNRLTDSLGKAAEEVRRAQNAARPAP